ncbi:MAG: hypothetical protein SGILL_001358 [Bacillariaceae sp.]
MTAAAESQLLFQVPPPSKDDHGDPSAPSKFRDLQILYQDQAGVGHDWECTNLDVVDACRGTSVSKLYRGNFEVYRGPCRGKFLEGLPIYRSTDRPNKPLYIYPLDRYPETWSFAPLRGLVRWRIVSFKSFDDRTSCRIEDSNIFQLEFAADGHPYDYFPTIYCFDSQGADTSGFQTSNINIRCNDVSATTGGASGIGSPTVENISPSQPVAFGDPAQQKTAGVVMAVLGVFVIIGALAWFLWNRYKERISLTSYSRQTEVEIGGARKSSNKSDHFHDEPEEDQEQPSTQKKRLPRGVSSKFTVEILRQQLNESSHALRHELKASSHALREEVRDMWQSLHNR